MNKFLDFGRKALFYVRVLSGYEERRIRSYRLQLEERVRQAQARRAAINKVPEQIILSEVRRMVEEMQALNKKLEETEAVIEEYFQPIDKEAEIIMKLQLQGEEKTSEMMMQALQQQAMQQAAMRQKFEAEKITRTNQADNIETNRTESEMMMKTCIGEEEKASKDSVYQAGKSDINPILSSTITPKGN